MAAMRRKLVWVERQNFQGWICNECAWVFKPSGTITGRSLDEIKGELRAAARPEVQISCLYRAPESHKKSRLAKSLAGQMRGSRVPQGSCPSKQERDRKSTRLNSSHPSISYAVFCLKKKI